MLFPTAVGIGDYGAIVGNATATYTFDITESGALGRLVIGDSAGKSGFYTLTSLKYNANELISGEVPVDVFEAAAQQSPIFGQYVQINNSLTAAAKGYGAATTDDTTLSLGWTYIDRLQYSGQLYDVPEGASALVAGGGRRVVAYGSPVTDIAAAASATMTWTISEPGILSRLFAANLNNGSLDGLTVTSVKLNNDEYIVGDGIPGAMFAPDCIRSPIFNVPVKVSDKLTATARNDSGSSIKLSLCFGAR